MEEDGGASVFCIFCDNLVITTSSATTTSEDCVPDSPPDLSYVKLLCRHLKVPGKEEEDLVVCQLCAHLGSCFHDLYFQLEVIKLRMNWMVERIYGRMKTGNQMERDGVPKSVRKWRKQLIKACDLELHKSCQSGPKVFLTRLNDEEEEFSPQKKPKYLPTSIKVEGGGANIKTELNEDAEMQLLVGTLSFLAVLALSLPQEPPEEQFLVPEVRIVTVSSVSTLETKENSELQLNPSGVDLETAEDRNDCVPTPSRTSPLPVAQETEEMEVVETTENEEEDDDVQIIEPEHLLPFSNTPVEGNIVNNYVHPGWSDAFVADEYQQQHVLEKTQTPFYNQNQYQQPSSLEAPSDDVNIRNYPVLRNILTPPSPADVVGFGIPPSQNSYLPPPLPYQQPATNCAPLNSTRPIMEAPVQHQPLRARATTIFPPVLPQQPLPPPPNVNPFERRGEPRPPPPPYVNLHEQRMEPQPPPPNVNPFERREESRPPPLIPIPTSRPLAATSDSTSSTLNYSCEVCHRSYSSASEVGRHRVIKHNLVYFLRCNGCRSIFGTEWGLKKHQFLNKNSPCNPEPEAERHQHQQPHVPPRPATVTHIQEPAAPSTPSQRPTLPATLPPPPRSMPQPPPPRQTQPRFPPISPQECELCCTRFLTEEDVEQHRRQAHHLQRTVRCKVCGSRFQTRSGLEKHQRFNRSSRCNPEPEPPSSAEPEVVEIVQPPPPQISWRILTENMPPPAPPGPMPPEAVLAPPLPQMNWGRRKRTDAIQTSGTVPLALPKCAMCDEYFNNAAHLLIHLRVVHKRGQEGSSTVQVINLD